MYMHRVTVKNLVAPHYKPRNTYVHMYCTYSTCVALDSCSEHIHSVDVPSSLSLS